MKKASDNPPIALERLLLEKLLDYLPAFSILEAIPPGVACRPL
jgi:hypothetical protein